MVFARHLCKSLTPPVLWQSFSAARARLSKRIGNGRDHAHGKEQTATWYDGSFEENLHWKQHYTESRYFPLWSIVADRIVRNGLDDVLDIGCGPGQFASLLRDRGIQSYCGIDFSLARINHARVVCPEFEFAVEDAFETDRLNIGSYRVVVMTEFLEHIEKDCGLLLRIRPGTLIIASLPDFPYASHVRHFCSVAEVKSRYCHLVDDLRVEALYANGSGKRFFILEAKRT